MVDLETLQERWQAVLATSATAVGRHPCEYKSLKKSLNRVLSKPVDVGEYYSLARRLTQLMETFREGQEVTLFDYFCPSIDPSQNGSARYFRFYCIDLQARMNELDTFRSKRCQIRLVRGGNCQRRDPPLGNGSVNPKDSWDS